MSCWTIGSSSLLLKQWFMGILEMPKCVHVSPAHAGPAPVRSLMRLRFPSQDALPLAVHSTRVRVFLARWTGHGTLLSRAVGATASCSLLCLSA